MSQMYILILWLSRRTLSPAVRILRSLRSGFLPSYHGSNGMEYDPKDQSLTHLTANAFALLLSYCETL